MGATLPDGHGGEVCFPPGDLSFAESDIFDERSIINMVN
jgi:hypothetical protein